MDMIDNIFFIPFDGQTVVASQSARQLSILNDRAAFIARQLQTDTPLDKIVEELAMQNNDKYEDVQHEVESFAGQWHEFVPHLHDLQQTSGNTEYQTDCSDHELHPDDRKCSVFTSVSNINIAFHLNDVSLLAALETALGELEQLNDHTHINYTYHITKKSGEYSCYIEDTGLQNHVRLDDLLISLRGAISHRVCTHYPSIAWMHAGCVVSESHALLFAGHGGIGKTTLVAYLSSQGFGYLSEDVTVLTPGIRPEVKTMQMPLSIKSGSWASLSQYYPELSGLPDYEGLNKKIKFLPVNHPLSQEQYPVRSIFFPKYDPEVRSKLEPVTPADALAGIVTTDSILPKPLQKQQLTQFLGWLEQTPAYNLYYPDMQSAKDLIVDTL